MTASFPLSLFPLLLLLSSLLPLISCQLAGGFLTATMTGLYPSFGSFMGGTQLTITGSGFARANTAGSTTVDIGGWPCVMIDYYTTDTQFVCTTASVGTFFIGSITLPVQMTLLGTGYGSTAICAGGVGGCMFTYTYSSTPYLDSIGNNLVVPGTIVQYSGLFPGQFYTQYDDFIGDTRCVMGWNVPSPANQEFAGIAGDFGGDVGQSCQVSNQTAGRYLFSLTLRPSPDINTLQPIAFPYWGYGAALVNNATLKVTDDGTIYTVIQAPVILGLSSRQSATTGGLVLTVTGLGFSPICADNAVTVGPTPAAFLNCSTTALVVQTAPSTATSTLEASAGVYGSASYAYAPGSLGSAHVGTSNELQINGLVQTQGDGPQTWTALLTVPYTAQYSFYVYSGYSASLSISTDNTPANQATILSFTSGGSNGYYTAPQQVSSPVSLTAGTNYYLTATVNVAGFRVSARVHQPGQSGSTPFLPSDTTAHALYQSFPTLATLTIAPTITREVQTIIITGATGGAFQLSTATSTLDIPYPLAGPTDTNTISALSAFANTFSACGAAVVGTALPATGNTKAGVSYALTFNCPSPLGGRPTVAIANVNLTGSNLGFHWARTQLGSVPIGGTYRVGFQQGGTTTWSSPVSAFSGFVKYDLQAAMAAVGGSLASVSVSSWTFATSGSTSVGDGVTFQLQMSYVGGDASQVFMFDTSALTGSGSAASLAISQTGSLDRWFSPIPADWLSVASDQAQVSVQTNGIRAICATAAGAANNLVTWVTSAYPSRTDCQLVYSTSLVPTVTSISSSSGTAGSVITLTGTGFDPVTVNNLIHFQPQFTAFTTFPPCVASSASTTQLVCTVPALSGGAYQVSVQVVSAGVTDPAATPVVFTFNAVYSTPNPLVLTGSIAGGALLVLTGSGFHPPASLSFMGNDSFVESSNYSAAGGDAVTVGGQTCVLEDVTFSLLICRVPAANPQVAGQVPVSINGQSLGSYTYATASTPQVTAISPDTASAAVTTVITITGSGFTVPASYPAFFYSVDTDNPFSFTLSNHASVYDNSLYSEFAVHFGSRACVVLTVNSTVITCQITRSAPINPLVSSYSNPPSVYVMGQGYAQTQELDLILALQIRSVQPQIGSINGGQYLTIQGQGFVAQSTTGVSIDILTGVQLSDYPHMTTSSVGMHTMSRVGEVAREDRIHPMQAGHTDPHPSAKPTTPQSILDEVLMHMHMRTSTKAQSINPTRFNTLSTGNFEWSGYSIPCAITSMTFTEIICFHSAHWPDPGELQQHGLHLHRRHRPCQHQRDPLRLHHR